MSRYVDADELADLLTPIIDGYDVDDKSAREWIVGYNECCLDLLKELKKMPAADVQKVNPGKWINLPGLMPMCSVCGELSRDADEWASYCPHCGALMDYTDEVEE